VNTADLCGLAALQYPKRHGPPTESEIKLLEMLLPHLRRAVRISSEMSELKNGFRAAHDLLNALSVGVILLNRAGRAMFLNRMAEDIVAGSDGFSLDRSGCPRAARPQEARDLARAIADAARSLGSPDVSPGGALRVTRTSGLQPFEILVSPVSDGREALGLGESPTVMLFLVDPERRPELPSVPLQRLFWPHSSRSPAGFSARAIGFMQVRGREPRHRRKHGASGSEDGLSQDQHPFAIRPLEARPGIARGQSAARYFRVANAATSPSPMKDVPANQR
jgi:hypothetical protein